MSERVEELNERLNSIDGYMFEVSENWHNYPDTSVISYDIEINLIISERGHATPETLISIIFPDANDNTNCYVTTRDSKFNAYDLSDLDAFIKVLELAKKFMEKG